MASFVESATLKLIDDSSVNIRKINRELKSLFKTAQQMKSMRIDIKGLPKASSEVRKLQSDLAKLRKPTRVNVQANTAQATSQVARLAAQLRALPSSKSIRINTVSTGVVPNVQNGPTAPNARNARPQGRRGFVGAGFGGIGVGLGGFSPTGAAATAIAFAAGREAAREVIRSAAEDTTQRNLGFAEQEVRAMADAARNATGAQLLLTETQKRAAARNLYTAGVQGEKLNALTDTVAQTESALSTMFGADEARRIQETIIKEVDLAGGFDRPVAEVSNMLEGIAAAQLTFGQDFNQKTFIAALRTSQAATRLTTDAMVNFASVVDEQGQRAGSRLQRFNKILTSAGGEGSGVNATQINLLEASGIRVAARRNAKLLEEDFGEFIRQEVSPVLSGKGINLDDAVAVKKGLQDLGFTSQELALVEAEIIKRRERARDRERARQVRFDRFRENAEKDIGLAMKAVAAQFKDLSSAALGPAARLLAPALVDVAEGFDDLAKGNINAKSIRSAITGAALAAGTAIASNPEIAVLGVAGFRLTSAAGNLNMAASALTRAANVQQRGGGVTATSPNGRRGGGAGRAIRGGIGGSVAMGVIEAATGGSVADAAGVAAGAFVGGVVGSLGGPAGTAIGAYIGGEIGRNHGEVVVQAMTSGTKMLMDAVKATSERTKTDPLVNDVVIPTAKDIVSGGAGFIADILDARDRQASGQERILRIDAADIRIDRLTDRLDRDAPKPFTQQERTDANALRMWDELGASVRNAITPRTNEILDGLRTAPPTDPTGTALDLAPLEMSVGKWDAVFATGAMDLSSAGSQIGSSITDAGATLGAQGTTIGSNAQSAFNAPALGQQIGSSAAAAISAAVANIRVNVGQSAGPNTGATGTPVE